MAVPAVRHVRLLLPPAGPGRHGNAVQQYVCWGGVREGWGGREGPELAHELVADDHLESLLFWPCLPPLRLGWRWRLWVAGMGRAGGGRSALAGCGVKWRDEQPQEQWPAEAPSEAADAAAAATAAQEPWSCLRCGVAYTPCKRNGPNGKKTLCNGM